MPLAGDSDTPNVHRLVDTVLARQLRRCQLTPQRLQSNLRLEIRRIPLPLARHLVRPSQEQTELNPLSELPGPPQKHSGKTKLYGVPYDARARMILLYLQTQRNVSTTLIHPGSSFRLGTAGLGSVS